MSKYTEKEIASEALKLINEYGELTTTELIALLREGMQPDGHDVEIIKGRNDDYFSQKVRNLTSHKTLEKFVNTAKVGRNTLYKSKQFISEVSQLGETEIITKLEQRKEKAREFKARKVEFEKINAENREVGLSGECLVFENEKKYLSEVNVGALPFLEHTSKDKGDGAGYDILSFDENNNFRYLEVKTTKGKMETPFYMSINEYDFMQYHLDDYELVRVYNFDKANNTGDIKYIKGIDIEATFEFKTSTYKVVFK